MQKKFRGAALVVVASALLAAYPLVPTAITNPGSTISMYGSFVGVSGIRHGLVD